MPDRILSVTEAAATLGVTRQAVGKLIRAGRLKASRVGNQWCVRSADLDRIKYGRPGPRAKK